MNDQNADLLPIGFRDVDATRLEKIERCLNTLATLEDVRIYKEKALRRLDLGPDSSALDVACGTGDDVARIRPLCARSVGVDRSANLIAQARSRHAASGCEFIEGAADAIPFPTASFDAVRIDRALQHIENPGQVVIEMARLAKPGGTILCAEPDWGTYLLGGPHSAITERIQTDWIRNFQNPWIGRALPSLLRAAGVGEIGIEAHWLPTFGFEKSDILFEIASTARSIASEMPEALSWLEGYRQSEAYAGVLMLICWGKKA